MTWSPMESGTTRQLTAIWAASPSDIFVVGGSETDPGYIILRFDADRWTVVEEGGPFHLLGISGTDTKNIYAVGGVREGDAVFAAILHYNGSKPTFALPLRTLLFHFAVPHIFGLVRNSHLS